MNSIINAIEFANNTQKENSVYIYSVIKNYWNKISLTSIEK